MDVYFRSKLEVSSLILTSFRQAMGEEGGGGVILPSPLPTSKQAPKHPNQIRVKIIFYISQKMESPVFFVPKLGKSE